MCTHGIGAFDQLSPANKCGSEICMGVGVPLEHDLNTNMDMQKMVFQLEEEHKRLEEQLTREQMQREVIHVHVLLSLLGALTYVVSSNKPGHYVHVYGSSRHFYICVTKKSRKVLIA